MHEMEVVIDILDSLLAIGTAAIGESSWGEVVFRPNFGTNH